MPPLFQEHKKYHVVYRSNERKNARTWIFIGDCLGQHTHDEQEIMFSCRPESGTLSINTRWYIFDQVTEVPSSTPNSSPRKL